MSRKLRQSFVLSFISLVTLNLLLAACGTDSPLSDPAQTAPTQASQLTTTTTSPTSPATTAPQSQATAPANPVATATPVPVVVPRFEAANCPFKLGKGQVDGQNINCGYLVTWAEHKKAQGQTLRLAVAILKSTGSKPAPQPLVYLEGGPGGPVEGIIRAYSDSIPIDRFPAKSLLNDHNMIFIDQRGVGYSVPTLECFENNELIYADLVNGLDLRAKKDEDLDKRDLAALDTCYKRLVTEGNDLSDFNTAENAADINDLRLALGYDKIDLFGVSYGTQLALTVMREFPQGLRSVILDSTVPLQADIYAQNPANLDRSLKVLFKNCAANPACNRAYPNLAATFIRAIARLNAEPGAVEVTDPRNGKTYLYYVQASSLLNVFFQSFYDNQFIPAMPVILAGIDNNNYDKLSQLLSYSLFGSQNISDGMYYSVDCSEAVAFSSPEAITNNSRNTLPEIQKYFVPSSQKIFKTCQHWPVKPANSVETQPVVSDLPTLVMSGEYDPITPPSYGQLAAKTLSKSFWMQFPGIGHGVVFSSACGTTVAAAFLQNPATRPDASCIAGMSTKFVINN